MLTRIRNAHSMKHKTVSFPASNLKFGICEVLKNEGYIKDATQKEEGTHKEIEIVLKYPKFGKTVLHDIRRVSKPGRRYYIGCEDIGKYKGGLGISVLSTSKGIMSDKMAKKEGLGGELICKVW